jgi:alpha-tubulin suppressor-like RCC1 family protein
LGQGSIGDHSYSPIPVPGLSNVVIISSGFECPEALKSDGTLWMWGYNDLGELENGNQTNEGSPGQVLNLTNMIYPGLTGDRDNCAIRADHTLWTWGRSGPRVAANQSDGRKESGRWLVPIWLHEQSRRALYRFHEHKRGAAVDELGGGRLGS